MFRLTFLLSLFLQNALANARASEVACRNRLGFLLTDQEEALKTVLNHPEYKVSILEGEVEKRKVHIVFLGETHVKSQMAYELGKDIVDAFPFRGLEGSINIGIGSPAAKAITRTLYPILAKLLYGTKSADSTIRYAAKLSDRSDAENIKLEEGFTPNIYDHINSITLPLNLIGEVTACGSLVVSGVVGACALGLNLLAPENPAFANLSEIAKTSAGLAIMTSGTLFAIKRSSKFPPEELRHRLRIEYTVGERRDENMVTNIVNTFNKRSDQNVMLVVVGKGHMKGMEKLLKEKFNFSDITADLGGFEPSSEQQR